MKRVSVVKHQLFDDYDEEDNAESLSAKNRIGTTAINVKISDSNQSSISGPPSGSSGGGSHHASNAATTTPMATTFPTDLRNDSDIAER